MFRRSPLPWAALALLLALPAQGEDEAGMRRAHEEVEKEMSQLVKLPPSTVKVQWTGIDKDIFGLDEARFELDGERLSYGEAAELLKPGTRQLYQGPVEPGTHKLTVTLTLHRSDVSLFSGLRTTKYAVSSELPFPGARGLAVTVSVGLHVTEKETDPKKQLSLVTKVKPEMVAKLDDTPPAPLPVVPPPVVRVEAEPTPPPVVREEPPPLPSPQPEPVRVVATEPRGEKHPKPSHLVDALRSKLLLQPPTVPPPVVVVASAVVVEDAGPPSPPPPAAVVAAPPPSPPTPVAPPPAPESPAPLWAGLGLVVAMGLVGLVLFRKKKG